MRVLLTNDDGIAAEGLAVLERIAATLASEVWVVAPESEQSGVSRALTLNQPLRVRSLGERRYAVSGTPGDCVTLAVLELMKDARPDLVLSGVNRGHNLAEDVTRSGTVAGAIEGMALGVPAIALSQAQIWRDGKSRVDFSAAEAFAAGIIERLVEVGWPDGVVINVNFPGRPASEVAEVEVTRQGFRDVHTRDLERRTDLRGGDYFWIGYRNIPSKPADGTDLRAFYDGKISVTPLHIDLTHMPTVHELKARLGGPPPRR
ncbi:MAG TPA: 5'/3'-nucleotidase SurE [Caulobacteraceae bacterium]|nr:5'/3'-nucleotidase SurE [Caulobacteraceae bacterium]